MPGRCARVAGSDFRHRSGGRSKSVERFAQYQDRIGIGLAPLGPGEPEGDGFAGLRQGNGAGGMDRGEREESREARDIPGGDAGAGHDLDPPAGAVEHRAQPAKAVDSTGGSPRTQDAREAQPDGEIDRLDRVGGKVDRAVQDLVELGRDIGQKRPQYLGVEPPVRAVRADHDTVEPGFERIVDLALHVVDLVGGPDKVARARPDHGKRGDRVFGRQRHERPGRRQTAERKGRAKLQPVCTAVDGSQKARGTVDADFEKRGHGRGSFGPVVDTGGHRRTSAASRRGAGVADERLIVALDVGDAVTGLSLVDRIGDACAFYKIGLGMLTGGGLALARELKDERGKRVFLDLKLFDIGATVEAAVRGLARFEPDFLTVHGDPHVVRAARAGAGGSAVKILAVTVLTSLDRGDLDACMYQEGEVAGIVVERARRALQAGADGVICSPAEAAAVRTLPVAAGRLIVTPGVRPAGTTPDDQKRVMTPAGAIAAGADHIVVGRPVWQAADPRRAAEEITASLG